MKKNRTYLLSAAMLMLFAVFNGISMKSVAADTKASYADEAMFILEQCKVQILNNKNNDTSCIEYAKTDVTDTSEKDDINQQNLTVTAKPSQTIEAQATGAVAKANQTKSVKELIWFKNGDKVFKRQSTAQVTDVLTGKSFVVKRKGGTNHADVEPVTAKDTKTMKSVYGGSWSWDRRAIWVEIDGQLYAGSMNGMPHGRESVTNNNFYGHFCIHFTNSRTHGTNRVDERHQAAIIQALNTKP